MPRFGGVAAHLVDSSFAFFINMAKGKKIKGRLYNRRFREEEEKPKGETTKRAEERFVARTIPYFKSEEMQEICNILNIEELLDDHQCFLGAVVIGKFEVVKRLLKDGHSIDFLDENHDTALMHAVKHFRLEMIDFLLARGADVSMVDGEGNTVLLLAAQSDLWDQDSFSGLWASARTNPRLAVDHTNKMGYSLLHLVTKRQWVGVLGSLLSVPVPLNCCTNKGVTPLIMAASRGDAVFVQALLEAGADISLEDQQNCTALCYGIAFSLQKNLTESNKALELLLAAIHDDNSKLSLEHYLQRRLELLLNPPKNKAEWPKTVSGVLVHVMTFFARFIYSGIELLLELSVFHKLHEALERHLEDPDYIMALLAVILELVRHCDCCSQGLSQTELADAFFAAELGGPFLHILHRYRLTKTSMIKAVFMPLQYVCTSDSSQARAWLESYQDHLHPCFNKYMRAYPAVFMETNGVPHLEIEKKCTQSFQTIMRTLKSKSKVVTNDDHSGVGGPKKVSQQLALLNSEYNAKKPNSIKVMNKKIFNSVSGRRKSSKPFQTYSSIIQHNFGKLQLPEVLNDSPNKELTESSEKVDNSLEITPPLNKLQIEKKDVIKEVDSLVDDDTVYCNENLNDSFLVPSKQKALQDSKEKTLPMNDVKERFTEGYQLFKMEDEVLSDAISEEEYKITKERCEWLDSCGSLEGNKSVSEVEVNHTINYLEEIFNRILNRYDSRWRKQFEKGYLEAEGDSEDLLKLMSVLPALENYHMEKLMSRWKSFCNQFKDHARKNHVVYAAMVSDMQLFLLEFESKLDENNLRLSSDLDDSSEDSFIDTEMCLKHGCNEDVNTLSDGRPVECLINNYTRNETESKIRNERIVLRSESDTNNENVQVYMTSKDKLTGSGDAGDNMINSIWDFDVGHLRLKSNLNTTYDTEVMEQPKGTPIKDIDPSSAEDITTREENLLDIVEVAHTENCVFSGKSNEVKAEVIEELDVPSGERKGNKFLHLAPEKAPPGFEHFSSLQAMKDGQGRAKDYCGAKYELLSIALTILSESQVEQLNEGRLCFASQDFQTEFTIFNGLNFGNVEFGRSKHGMPLAVRQFQKFGTVCNQLISSLLHQLVRSMLHLRHENILPYVSVCDQPQRVVFATPLCYYDLGQYVRRQREVFADNLNAWATFIPTLMTMAKQMISGLHYLHTLTQPVVHGNLKPSNILVDVNGTLMLAEFGLHKVLFQQHNPPQSAMIWWARECQTHYVRTWKYECTSQSDIQSAGMVVYFILTMGEHPFGQSLPGILQNIMSGVIPIRSQDVNTTDLIYWMLASNPECRPTTTDVLRHPMFWNNSQRWEFLRTCCGQGVAHHLWPLPLDKFYADLDALARNQEIHTVWISILKKNCECKVGTYLFDDTPSGLLKFIAYNLKNWADMKDNILVLFPALPLNLFRMVEQTTWLNHPEFEPFIRIGPVS